MIAESAQPKSFTRPFPRSGYGSGTETSTCILYYRYVIAIVSISYGYEIRSICPAVRVVARADG